MAGYKDTRQLIIDTLMNRPAGTEIQPENHQEFALAITDYVRSVELLAGNAFIGFAEANTAPIQSDKGQCFYISTVGPGQTVNFVNFIDSNGNAISVSSPGGKMSLVTLIWNTQYWSSQIVTMDTNWSIAQQSGSSESMVMSQKAITDELNKKVGNGVLAQTTDIASGAITGPKIAENSITTSKIVDGTIQSTDINSNAFDPTLKNAGKLADAKAVGDAIATEETRAKEAEENLVGKVTDLEKVLEITKGSTNLFDSTATPIRLAVNSGNFVSSSKSQCYIIPITPNSTISFDNKFNGNRCNLYTSKEEPAVGVSIVGTYEKNNTATFGSISVGSNENYLLFIVNVADGGFVDMSGMRVYYGTEWIDGEEGNAIKKMKSDIEKLNNEVNISYFEYTTPSELPILECIKGVAIYDNSWTPKPLYLLKMWRQAATDKIFVQLSENGTTMSVQLNSTSLTNNHGLVEYRTGDKDYPLSFLIDVDKFKSIPQNSSTIGYKFKFDTIADSFYTIVSSNTYNNGLQARSATPFLHTPIVIFRSDDGILSGSNGYQYGDDTLVSILDKYGLKCMFGLIGNTIRDNGKDSYLEIYKSYANKGHCIVSHGNTTDNFTSLSQDALKANVSTVQSLFAEFGIYPNGVIYPEGLTNESVDNELKKVYNYAVIGGSEIINDNPNAFQIKSMSYQSKTLEEMKAAVDKVISNGKGVLCFGGHAYRLGTSGNNSFGIVDELCQYIKSKIDSLDVRSINPDDAIAEIRKYY